MFGDALGMKNRSFIFSIVGKHARDDSDINPRNLGGWMVCTYLKLEKPTGSARGKMAAVKVEG